MNTLTRDMTKRVWLLTRRCTKCISTYKKRDKYVEIAKQVGAPSTIDQLLNYMDLPYSAKFMVVPLPPKFKVPQMELYNKTKDPLKHLDTFKAHMTLHGFPNEVSCLAFSLTLKGGLNLVWIPVVRDGREL